MCACPQLARDLRIEHTLTPPQPAAGVVFFIIIHAAVAPTAAWPIIPRLWSNLTVRRRTRTQYLVHAFFVCACAATELSECTQADVTGRAGGAINRKADDL